jgi:DNA polymerase III delta prime subunit
MANELIFPEHGDPDFAEKIASLREYQMYAVPETPIIEDSEAFKNQADISCGSFEKALYQHLMAHYLSRRSPYRSLLIYHGLGVGKTCSALTIAEALLIDHTNKEEPRILIVCSKVLRKSFEEQIFSINRLLTTPQFLKNQCNGDLYLKLVQGTRDIETLRKKVATLIKSRYRFLTYDGLIDFSLKNPKIHDKVIIVDEAHNMRVHENNKKKASDALEKILNNGENNRLVLLSATPMYNEPDEIFWLLSLLLRNDKRTLPFNPMRPPTLFNDSGSENVATFSLLKQLSSEYISYIRGTNPFTFAAKLSPSLSGIECLKNTWAQEIEEGIVITPPGNLQLKDAEFEANANNSDDESTVSAASGVGTPLYLQLSNISYADKTGGKKGFRTVFTKTDENDPIEVTYKPQYEDYLFPDSMHLGRIASKMQKIIDYIQKSEGIVVIYSQFVWSGIIPIAIALEHLGFKRHGTRNILDKPHISESPVRFEGIPFPSYCILSSGQGVMGSTNIDSLLTVINSKENIHGSKIKVILMTPVAGEGLSFRNIREVHILDPWYHMNRIDQVIGRAIRTCQHNDLPLEERNVTVFLHVSSEADIHAYKIAARKLQQTNRVEALIRDSAIDCKLLYNVNYYSRDIFNFSVVMRTSQRALVSYKYGDDPKYKPKCGPIDKTKHANSKSMRIEVMENLMPTLLQRIEKYIQKNLEKSSYFSIDELIAAIRSDEQVATEAIHRSLHPHILIPGYKILPHLSGIVVIPNIIKQQVISIKLPEIINEKDAEEYEKNKADDLDFILKSIVTTNKYISILSAYGAVNSTTYPEVAKKLIEDDVYEDVRNIFIETGALITKSEIPRMPGGRCIGFVNIFNTSNFEVILYDSVKKIYRPASDQEIQQIKRHRDEIAKPDGKRLFAILEPHRFGKSKNDPYRFAFKIITADTHNLSIRGEICNSKKMKELDEIMKAINLVPEKKTGPGRRTRDQVCYSIQLKMLMEGLLFTYPQWKPKPI